MDVNIEDGLQPVQFFHKVVDITGADAVKSMSVQWRIENARDALFQDVYKYVNDIMKKTMYAGYTVQYHESFVSLIGNTYLSIVIVLHWEEENR